jgi:hypothetical protein
MALKSEPNSVAHWKISMAGAVANTVSQVLYPLENVKLRF